MRQWMSCLVPTRWVLSSFAHLHLQRLRLFSQHHLTRVIDVEDVVLVHDPPAEHFCSIFDEPPSQRPAPHKGLQHVGWAPDKTFGLDAVWVRFRPEHGEG